ncbi:MAG: pentapeptide repeat-containing protein [Nostoc sp. DedVER02]|uniref:pentapeptide repeat-containing protein n=1 Tax=unclassified Nostoc TaxID=2593658 RepID=UPI002AD31F60|nr:MULTISPECIES: pentapeptide repeat-containing protein [unclassified Nostoc]MDZ7988072.1 pentapeptide repeat-containing protein [Nostoc sp. DedVER02]MDZ8111663.1 pentapeptide repeat-containing protein [Nostoc sp. DedVER01b]
MLTVIIIFFHAVKNISLINNAQLSKIYLTIDTLQEKISKTRHKSPKECLNIAIEQLGNNTIKTSLTVINDLEQIAQNHPQYHWIIMNILSNFLREKTLYLSQEEVTTNLSVKVRADIQAALTVIARRDVNKDPENEQLDLSHIDMRGVNLNGANLQQINLYQANLTGANLTEANLAGSILSAANLEGANLYLANLEGAILSAANLKGANLTGANLHYASLYLANLHGAILNDAILDRANLREVKLSE